MNNVYKKINKIVYGILIPIVVYVAITFLVSFCISFFYTNKENMNILLLQSIANMILIILYVPYYIYMLKKNEINIKRFNGRHLMYLIGVGFSVCIICNVLLQFLPSTKDNIVSKEIMALLEKYNIYIVLLIVSVIVPIVEELVFRGFIYDTILCCFNVYAAIVVSALLFALAHGNIEQGIYAFVAGIFLGYIRFRYNNVIYTIIMHLAMNFSTIMFVPVTLFFNDTKHIIFIVFICLSLLLLSIYRIENVIKYEGEL